MKSSQSRNPFAAFVWDHKGGLALSLLLVFLMQFIEYHGWLAGVEGRILDFYVKYVPRLGGSKLTAPIVTVEIDDTDYVTCFKGQSPLNPETIQSLLEGLIGDSKVRHPSVLGIDILTDAEHLSYGGLRALPASYAQTQLIWTAPILGAAPYAPSLWRWMGGAEDELKVEAGSVLGYSPFIAIPSNVQWAIPVFPTEEDLRLRRFPRQVKVLGFVLERETWAARIATAYRRGPVGPSFRDVIVTYDGPVEQFPMGALFDCKEEPIPSGSSTPPRMALTPHDDVMAKFRRLVAEEDPIVLVGGTFANARDEYQTSEGPKFGLHINAYAMQADLAGHVVREAWRPLLIGFDIIVGISIVTIFSDPDPSIRSKMRRSLLVLPGALLLSTAAFWLGFLWLSVIGVATGLMPHLLVEIYGEDPQIKHSHPRAHARRPGSGKAR
jgi:CHASE2 domain-containing sensor protein